jgi:glycine/D-amino acid oxidase-like deaminating enzyme
MTGKARNRISASIARRVAEDALALANSDGRADRKLRNALQAIERRHKFTPGARAIFQDLLARVGVTSEQRISLPLDDRPFWFRGGHPYANFQSQPDLPRAADVVIIGAGLTGASAAYHFSDAMKKRGLHIVVLDQGDPAGEASGRNAGNFELIPENSVGVYEGLANERIAFLRKRYPKVPLEVLRAEGERQASVVLGLALRNRDRLKDIIRRAEIDCDFSPKGWLYLAHTEHEEQGICEEVTLAAAHGQRIEVWSRGRILAEFGFRTKYLGRFIPGDGTYHPFKYVCGMLRSALHSGVELYTRTRVEGVTSLRADRHRVVTDRGTVIAKSVIVATNAFTRNIFPELRAIRPRQSQIMITEHAPDHARGRIVTSEYGPVFFNQPREGARGGRAPLLMGGGDDRSMTNPSSRRRSTRIHAHLLRLRDKFYPGLRGQPPSAEWVGPMGFTPDQLPAIGFLRPGLIVAAGFNGYGGTYTTAAGQAAAEMALDGRAPEWVPEDIFSPRRLLDNEPLFMNEHDSLWRIAASICRQLKTINRQISEALSYGHGRATPKVAIKSSATLATFKSSCASSIAPDQLKAFPVFADFSRAELAQLLALMRRWDIPQGTLLFHEGSLGGTCFIVVSGAVDVSIRVRGQQQLLAHLSPGSIFGQISLIEGEPRSATCTVSRTAVLVEIEAEPCEGLFDGRSKTALKFLAALNQGLILALRGADRQLLRLNLEGRVHWDRDHGLQATELERANDNATAAI